MMGGEQFPQDGWVEWSGGECPVAPGTQVIVRLRDGDEHGPVSAITWGDGSNTALSNWAHDGSDCDIIAYRVVKP